MTNLTNMLVDTAAEHGDRIAIRLDDLAIPYAGLEASTRYVAGLLAAKGVGPGDAVGVMLPNVPYFPSVFFGALRLGAVVVPMNPLLKEREVGFQLKDSGAKLIVAWHQFGAAAAGGRGRRGRGGDPRRAGRDRAGGRRRRADRGDRRARGRRHGADPLHVGHHGHAEGRRAHPRQPVRGRARWRSTSSRWGRTR